MTITLDAWQPVLIAVIGALATVAVPFVSALVANRNAKRAVNTAEMAATTAADTAIQIGDKVDNVAKKLDEHATAVSQMNVKLNGERTALMEKIAQMEQELIQERRRSRQRPDGG